MTRMNSLVVGGEKERRNANGIGALNLATQGVPNIRLRQTRLPTKKRVEKRPPDSMVVDLDMKEYIPLGQWLKTLQSVPEPSSNASVRHPFLDPSTLNVISKDPWPESIMRDTIAIS
ncbi:hypothetical protein Ancab_024856 [Ancistrocladus abbreviatus]